MTAPAMAKSTKVLGMDDQGALVRFSVFGPEPAEPQSVAEWAQQKIALLGTTASMPGGKILVRLLLADGPKARAAALAEGAALDPWQQHAVGTVLGKWREQPGYALAAGLARELHAAWVARFGDKEPKLRRARVWPAEGTGAASIRMGLA